MLVLLVLGLFVQGVRRADAGHHVLALGVDQPLAVELVLAGGRVAAEGHARGRRVAHVAEDHALHVAGGAPFLRNALDLAVGHGPAAVPTLEHGPDGAPKLLLRIVGERTAQHLLHLLLEVPAQTLEVLGGQVGVGRALLGLLLFGHEVLELDADALALGRLDVLGLLHDHVGVHHDQPAVGVVDEPLAARLLDQAGDRRLAEADVEHGFHHAGHGLAGPAAAGEQKRVLRVAVLHVHRLLGLGDGHGNFVPERLRKLASLVEIRRAEFRGNREAGGNGQAQARHLGQIRPLAAQEVFHAGIAIRPLGTKAINVLGSHV